jgi:ABC-type amino acid transport substrate-binding protein
MNTATPWPAKIGIALLVSWVPFVGPLVAQERPSEAGTLRVGVSPVFPPMAFKQGKELAGVEVALARALGESLGRKVIFVELPWEDQIEALNAGRIDIIMSSMSITMPRRYVLEFSRPYLVIGQMTLVRQEDQNRYLLGMPINLPGTVGVLKATTGEFLVQRNFPKARRKAFGSEAAAVQALKRKKIDLFISDSTLIWYLAGTHAAEGLAAVPRALSEEQLAWGMRKGDEKLLAAANEFIQKTAQDGTLNRVFRRWTAVAP